ncbi:hypothetical protein LF941_17090 [Pectobacterium versatile]|nr:MULTISPECIES: hypothetical protein [Pectobacterium]MBA0173485.1 hypothetical protein [Pectobacterium versatile]MBQ4765236.1 hypothetical protein [Pectobacterium versatile]MBQ4781213.1 hypothetical protein [Pectobacterium versatile]MBQ4785770.1 hypothetical protein [Pectobacterium versatile]MCA6917105.1 hypothetical protein [Pectobacterium versatile]
MTALSAAAISRFAVEPGFIAARAVPQLDCGTVKRLPGVTSAAGLERDSD